MSDFNTLSELRHFASFYGVKVNTNAPGDGVRRYEFALPKHGLLGRELGLRNAASWLTGYTRAADLFGGRETNPPREHQPHPGYKGADIQFSDDDYGVFLWKEDGVYHASDSVGNYKRESSAEKFADKLNEQHPRLQGGYVVRTLKYVRHP